MKKFAENFSKLWGIKTILDNMGVQLCVRSEGDVNKYLYISLYFMKKYCLVLRFCHFKVSGFLHEKS